jgi:hypothetical protein
MLLKIPNLNDYSCVRVGLCGNFVDEGSVREEEVYEIARHPKSKGLLRLMIGGDSTKRHFHCDYALRDYFGGDAPKPSTTYKDFCEILSRFEDRQIHVALRADYKIPQDDLPPLLSAARLNYEKSGISLTTTGGILAVKGIPVQEIEWRVYKDGMATVVFRSACEGKIDRELLTAPFSVMNDAAMVILKAKDNGVSPDK